MDQEQKPAEPGDLPSPFPPEREKSLSPSPSPKGTGVPSSDDLAAAAHAEIEDLSSDAADGFHSVVQLLDPYMGDMPEKKHQRISKALARELEKQGVKAAPVGLRLGVALLSGYGPLIKESRAARAAAKKQKGKPDDRDRGKAKDGQNDAVKVADLPVES